MSKNAGAHAFLLAASMASAVYAHADNAETANKSNNPLNLAPGANLQDYYTPKLYDTNAHTNDILMRGTLPIAPNDFIGVPQLLRATVPISTRLHPHRVRRRQGLETRDKYSQRIRRASVDRGT
jgi:hypothetical protein